ncbi:MAG: deaminase [Syntrophales bacterium]|nr:deaminase [Syntrophales bacterium]
MIRKSFSVFLIFGFFVPLLIFGPMTLHADATNPSTSLDKLEKRIASFKPDPTYRDDTKLHWSLCGKPWPPLKKGTTELAHASSMKKPEKLFSEGTTAYSARISEAIYTRKWIHLPAMNRESVNAQTPKVEGLVLYTSLEPCPMCLARIITAGVRKVYYLAPDPYGGMVHLFKNLPPIWQKIAEGRIYEPALCSPELKDIANKVFKYSSEMLDERLKKE